MTWNKTQEWEKSWWGTCQNTYGEEEKQFLYAAKMGISFFHDGKSPYNINKEFLDGKHILDVGGGPVSLLLKASGVYGVVVDPLEVPQWVLDRYALAGIRYVQKPAERSFAELLPEGQGYFNEIWMYNCLQHVKNPSRIVENMIEHGETIRVFEWLETRTNEGHPHTFTEDILNKWFNGTGVAGVLTGQANCYGKYYAGIFPGKHSEYWGKQINTVGLSRDLL